MAVVPPDPFPIMRRPPRVPERPGAPPESRFPADRAPRRPAKRQVALCLLTAAAALGGVEAYWRAAGFAPTLRESAELWAYHRNARRLAAPDAVVVLGTSRMHFAFDQDVFYERAPNRPLVQLSIWGSSIQGVLDDLADDPSFTGTVIAGFTGTPHNAPKFAPWAAEYLARAERGLGAADRATLLLRALRDSSLVLAGERFGWRAAAVRVARGGGPAPVGGQRIRVRLDRDAKIDLSGESGSGVRGPADDGRPPPPGDAFSSDAWRRRAGRVAATARRLGRRGCRVVFVRPPELGARLRWEEEFYPRVTHWDRFADAVEADGRNAALHFRDVPGMAGLTCPDGLHLDRRDAPAFTHALLDELERRGVL